MRMWSSQLASRTAPRYGKHQRMCQSKSERQHGQKRGAAMCGALCLSPSRPSHSAKHVPQTSHNGSKCLAASNRSRWNTKGREPTERTREEEPTVTVILCQLCIHATQPFQLNLLLTYNQLMEAVCHACHAPLRVTPGCTWRQVLRQRQLQPRCVQRTANTQTGWPEPVTKQHRTATQPPPPWPSVHRGVPGHAMVLWWATERGDRHASGLQTCHKISTTESAWRRVERDHPRKLRLQPFGRHCRQRVGNALLSMHQERRQLHPPIRQGRWASSNGKSSPTCKDASQSAESV
mmetsp:Transcript_3411/g.10740  ORF Transcript_3411/g.10740 Transcript_3411/m.10740 type:complete len:292 (-) Transcript_3411:386-1261(-)